MTKKNTTQYSSEEAKKIVADYIDESAVRLAQRLKKAYSEQKNRRPKFGRMFKIYYSESAISTIKGFIRAYEEAFFELYEHPMESQTQNGLRR